jgi:DNA-binding NtrC family response regulator
MTSRKILCMTLGAIAAPVEPHLRDAGWEVVVANDLVKARQILQHHQFFACVLVLPQTDPQTLDRIEVCMKLATSAEWLGVLGPRALESAAMRELIVNYFFDYHTDPVDPGYLARTLGHAYGRAMLRREHDNYLRSAESMGMVGQSAVIGRLRRQIRKVAATSAPVLIGGESGSGKELAAQAVHKMSNRARSGPFIAVNCGAISPSLIQSELFGHERGAYTGASTSKCGLIEAADGGTLFLDEIGDLSLDLQINLLRFLQEKTINRVGGTEAIHVDVRVIAASHVDLAEAVASGRFREDLFYRLNVLSIIVPPLRERKEDVPQLALHFFNICAVDKKTRAGGFNRKAMAALTSHDWPGNVRELYNRVQRAVVMTERSMISPSDLGLEEDEMISYIDLDSARTVAECDAIHLSLNRVGRNVTHAARELGISRMTLYRLMEKHGIALGGS